MWHGCRRGEAGVTLIELLVAMAMSLITLTATLYALEVVAKHQPRITEHSLRLQEARAALDRITRALRQTYAVNASSSTYLDVLTYKRTAGGQPAEQWRFVYDCGGGSCTWKEGAVDAPLGEPQILFSGVDNTDIFAYEPDLVNPSLVRIKFRFGVKNNVRDTAPPVTLSAGVQFRNVSRPI